MRSIAQLLQVSKASEEGSIQSRSSNNKRPRFLKPRVRCTAQQALLVQIFVQVHRGHSLRPRGHPQARHTSFPSLSLGDPKPTTLLGNKTKPLGCVKPVATFLPTVPPLTAKPAGSRRPDASRLTGGSFWGPSGPPRVEQCPLPAPRARRPGTQAAPQYRQAAVGYLLTRRLRPDFPH